MREVGGGIGSLQDVDVINQRSRCWGLLGLKRRLANNPEWNEYDQSAGYLHGGVNGDFPFGLQFMVSRGGFLRFSLRTVALQPRSGK